MRVRCIQQKQAQKCMDMTTTNSRYRSAAEEMQVECGACVRREATFRASLSVAVAREEQYRAHVFCLLLPLGGSHCVGCIGDACIAQDRVERFRTFVLSSPFDSAHTLRLPTQSPNARVTDNTSLEQLVTRSA